MKIVRSSTIIFFLLALPLVAAACPLCQGGGGVSKETIYAYKLVTAFMALMPIIGGIGIFYWIYQKKK